MIFKKGWIGFIFLHILSLTCSQSCAITKAKIANGNVYSWGSGQEGQLGHGEGMTFLAKPCYVSAYQLQGCVQQIAAGDCYSSALTANGELFMWGRNCHVIDATQPVSHKFWSARKIDLGVQDIKSVNCGHWHASAFTRQPDEQHHGNKESNFTETGERFKEDSHYPQLMELSEEEKSDGIRMTELKNIKENLETSEFLQLAIQPKQEDSYQQEILTAWPRYMDKCEINDTEMNLSSQSSSHVRDTEKFHSLDTIVNQTEKQRKGNISLPAKQNGLAVLPKRKQLQRSQSFSSLQSLSTMNVDVVPEERDKGHMPIVGITEHILPKIQYSKHCSSWAQITGHKNLAKELHCPNTLSKGPLQVYSSKALPTRVLGDLLNSRPQTGVQRVSVQQGNSRSTPHILPLTYGSAASPAFNLKSAERLFGRQPIYSSGTAWKDVSRSPDPVLSQKHLNSNSSCS